MCGCLNPHLPAYSGLAAVSLTGRFTPDLISWFWPGPTSCSSLLLSRRKSHSPPAQPSSLGPTSPPPSICTCQKLTVNTLTDNLEVPKFI